MSLARKALRLTYKLPEWVLMEEVRDGTGAHGNRYADALALNCYPSRGMELIGFEIKASRSDWKRELEKPAKAEAFVLYCDRWYVVQEKAGLVKPDELPKGWGLKTASDKGLIFEVEAERRQGKPLDRSFIASAVRGLFGAYVLRSEVNPQIEQARKDGQAEGRDSGQYELRNLREAVQKFEEASGVKVAHWDSGNIGAAVKSHLWAMHHSPLEILEGVLSHVKHTADELAVHVDALKSSANGRAAT